MTVNDMLESLIKANYKKDTVKIIDSLNLTSRQRYIARLRYILGWNALKIAIYGEFDEDVSLDTIYSETQVIVAKLGEL